MNSWKSIGASECAPPLMMFIIGTGNCLALNPPRYWYNSNPSKSAAALATAMETPKIAFAPNLPLFFVPSNSIIFLSIAT